MDRLNNKSKSIQNPDDSAARLLIDLLDGVPGRNFDIESIFVEKTKDGTWRFVIFEFLKSISVPPEVSHPNYYWYKNKRKFLSLWTIVKVLRDAGYLSDLYLVNYVDDKASVKLMRVMDVDQNSEKVLRPEKYDINNKKIHEVRDWVSTEDEVLNYSKFKKRFRDFNNNKVGETWDLLSELKKKSSS